jgi:two-component system, NarL family, response regulator LiaR
LKTVKVMIAEDHEDLLRALTRWLGRKYEIVAAVKDGKYLVEGAMSLRPDVIVSDNLMPLMTGPEALKELTARGCRVPFVFITSDTELMPQGTWSIVDKLDVHKELEAAIHAAVSGKVYVSRRAGLQKGTGLRKPEKHKDPFIPE